MKYTAITAIFALVATMTVASPVEMEARTGTTTPAPASSCSNTQAQVCCSGLLELNCLVQLIGNQCSGQAYCCDTSAAAGSLINIQALNCISLL
ncbi:hypothetical protein F4810DRAFT_688508 [Camillea tinctor]|nr:hypothetical protein F4810DRAFT_688508 [Camillea tinctor]